ncbi:hypothetical protein EJ05DRAFT_500508 [Pseudovirgaria hyperparasitica]|uniref:Uncharacterized protein n=1 Tax=Pseudovirgaria hyperparasitica TaxID=470096 RepID=A0A6A6W623_9PEZI|nr:uncharacterized protein EJ05DRAFT_500508 [Pseudovirgaria hyperparasitica]KAF2757995.1 hypothetical protein EJ05DRAFT_500508 [Pseudovirgaria hyperparasitica]
MPLSIDSSSTDNTDISPSSPCQRGPSPPPETPSKQPLTFDFLGLPPELRNRSYFYYTQSCLYPPEHEDVPIVINEGDELCQYACDFQNRLFKMLVNRASFQPPLGKVCRQISTEFTPLFQNNTVLCLGLVASGSYAANYMDVTKYKPETPVLFRRIHVLFMNTITVDEDYLWLLRRLVVSHYVHFAIDLGPLPPPTQPESNPKSTNITPNPTKRTFTVHAIFKTEQAPPLDRSAVNLTRNIALYLCRFLADRLAEQRALIPHLPVFTVSALGLALAALGEAFVYAEDWVSNRESFLKYRARGLSSYVPAWEQPEFVQSVSSGRGGGLVVKEVRSYRPDCYYNKSIGMSTDWRSDFLYSS